ncbi:DEAD/DEAH box helicase [Thauera chlorobenzoica]|uniref:ATP-dependent RNA helicase RhlE n=1 Tax=Thauera chlorobenzoica TaxID=96773 RepID=A0A1H5W2F4_9RHOO|nr:DEAD/DEAH box helicase [Thauera chlorobenzoica]APR03335.1 ATP-dependent RNA helicase RhlE [Thauera chlorobenzoica]SEF93406.1 ATP-dependent RNA helicase RhlE [Thauera chlorobenzoica]
MNSEVTFASLGLAAPLLRAIGDAGYSTPTPIQAQAIPQVLAGGDLLAAAQTGTGKTAGFTLPLLHMLAATHAHPHPPGRPRCLILTPTRELAAQVEESVKTYGKHLPLSSLVMFGGVNINPQIAALKKRVDILVATPGRLLDHVGQKTLDLSGVEILVLDEADRMLDMGFIRDIRKILALLPKKRQNLLFSATFSDEIRHLASGLLHNPGTVEVAPRNTTAERVDQAVYQIGQKHKRELLAHLIKEKQWFQALVFTRTKHGANKLAEYLSKHDIPAAAIHGNKSQAARTRALAQFKDGSLPVLVATDIAARGLDIDQLPQVVNFELPNVPEDYVHRIGRTGRAGAAGNAISLVDGEEIKLLTAIERLIKRRIERATAEDFVPSAGAEAAHDADHQRDPLPRRGGNRPERARSQAPARQAAAGSAARSGERPAGARAGAPGKPGGRPQAPRGEANGNRAPRQADGREIDGNRPPPARTEVNGNRAEHGNRRPDVDGNRLSTPRRGEAGGNRPQQRAALFSAKPGKN